MSDSKHDSIHADSRRIAGWMIGMIWLIVLCGGTWLAQGWIDARERARAPELRLGTDGRQELRVQANRLGQYQVRGSINGQQVDFLIDTGATGISVPARLANRLSISRGRPFEVVTANGRRRVFRTSLNSLAIGPFRQTNVRAHINPGLEGTTALLGMEFLSHYELLQRSGTLTISDAARIRE